MPTTRGDWAEVGRHLRAWEEVAEFEITDVLERAAGTQHVPQVGDDAEPDVDRHAPVDQISQVIVGERGGNDHLVDSEHFHDGRHLNQSAEYRETGQAPVRRVSICCHEADDPGREPVAGAVAGQVGGRRGRYRPRGWRLVREAPGCV